MALLTPYNGWAMTVQAVLYTNTAPNQKLHLFDADGDEFMFPIPGQMEEKIVTPEIAVTVKLPLSYYDEDADGGHQLKVIGYVEKPDSPLAKKQDEEED